MGKTRPIRSLRGPPAGRTPAALNGDLTVDLLPRDPRRSADLDEPDARYLESLPVSSSVLSADSTGLIPVAEISKVLGLSSTSSWTTVSRQASPTCSISQLMRDGCSRLASSSQRKRTSVTR